MTIFSVEFRTDAGFAVKEIEAATVDRAIAKARRLVLRDPGGLGFFQAYEGEHPVSEIIIEDEHGNEIGRWQSDELVLRLAAAELLYAARLVIGRWERGNLAAAVRSLAAVVAKVGRSV